MASIRVSFLCDVQVIAEFRKLVLLKYGFTHNVMQREFEAALQKHIESLKRELEGGSHG